jgi:tryptophan synthase alpha chain
MTVPAHERIRAAIHEANESGRTALVAYLTAGFPSRDGFADDLLKIARSADVVEIGVPFTDPMADGLTIQKASRRALEAGVTLGWILDQVAAVREHLQAPVLLMSYLNPLLAMGYERLAARAEQAGVAGFIVPDLPLEECDDLDAALSDRGLALVQLVSPVTPPDRLERAAARSRGFLYAVTVTGITGGASGSGGGFHDYLARAQSVSPVPVCAGFGVRSAEQVADIGRVVPGVVVGSALVEALEQGSDPAEFLAALRPEAA